jgi:heme A synthase
MIPGTWSHATAGALLLLFAICAAIAFRPRRRNRRVSLPAPSAACRRNSTEAVTR